MGNTAKETDYLAKKKAELGAVTALRAVNKTWEEAQAALSAAIDKGGDTSAEEAAMLSAEKERIAAEANLLAIGRDAFASVKSLSEEVLTP